jgi:two-component system chemotaxis response regulator CheB
MAKLIRVLVVDDSAFVRKVVAQMLSRSPFVDVVGTARDGEEALELVARLEPDVVTLDLVMPRVDGLEFLRRQMAIRPLPVVICSISHDSGAAALEAFELGAVEFVQKPTALATDRVFEMGEELLAKVKAASLVRMPHVPIVPIVPTASSNGGASAPAPRAPAVGGTITGRSVTAERADIVVIGISTGGPQALRNVIPMLPVDFPVPIAVVLHMPIGYTEMYARRLNEISRLDVVEARDGDSMRPGAMFLAPAGRHLLFARSADGAVNARLDLRPFDTPHRPAVDVLFRSAAEVYGSRVLGVVMTGMGNDGAIGSTYIKAKGGRVLTEAETSCIVYGMPRAVVEANASDCAAPLEEIANRITEMI